MRRLSCIFSALLAAILLLTCCEGIDPDARAADGTFIKLRVWCNEEDETKAGASGTFAGDDAYNENLISAVDFFFFPGTAPTGPAAYHIRKESHQKGYDVFLIDEVNSEIINNRIFPSSPVDIRSATVFAIANYPGTLVDDESNLSAFTLEYLSSLKVETDFAAVDKQADFMMSGSAVLDLRGRNQIMAASGSIQLSRYAGKLTVAVKVEERVTLSDNQVWYPMLEQMEVYLVNGVKTVCLSGQDPEPEYFSYSDRRCRFARLSSDGTSVEPTVGKTGDYYNTTPMYMYPQEWTYGATSGYEREPYLKLVVPWRRGAENGFTGVQKQFYYKIVIPDDIRGEEYFRRFVRNTWYHLDIEVGILGAETDEAAIPISPCSCFVVYWQDKEVVIKQAEIGNARYLAVENDNYVLHNVADLSIRYVSSHAAVIKEGSLRVTRPYYGESGAGTNTLGGTVRKAGAGDIYDEGTFYLDYSLAQRQALGGGDDWLTNTGVSIEFHHELNNDYTSATFDYSPYTVSFTIVHEDRPDDERYTKDIVLTQRPAVFIEGKRNSDNTMSYYSGSYHSEHWGYVFVDGEQIVRTGSKSVLDDDIVVWKNQGFDYGSDKEEYHWRVIFFTGGSRDIFKINATVLPQGTDLVIGDPRSPDIDNLDKAFHSFEAVDGTTRSLTYYYPTENSARTKNMMAPSYRIASKHGGVEFSGITLERARYRCATYQEDGYPAGRWRLPTAGEISFMAKLSSNRAFTFLFTTGSNYWSANGAITVGENGVVTESTTTAALARCVYDTWYWGDEQLEQRDKPVWGDLPR